MNHKAIERAIIEAKRFLIAAEFYKNRIKVEPQASFGCKEGGTLRRASHDLTSALANLRRRPRC